MALRRTPERLPAEKRGDEMTDDQRLYLHTLLDEVGEPYRDDLTGTQASELLDDLQIQTGRARD